MSRDSIAADLFRRIPALGDLRGIAKLDAEEAIRDALEDAVADYIAENEAPDIEESEP
jgi:hypothetical protein